MLSLQFLHFDLPFLVVCKLRNKCLNAYLVLSYLIATLKMISSKDVPQLVKKKNDAFSKSNKVLIEIASKTKSIHHLLPLLIDVASVYTQQCSIKSKTKI